MVRVASRGSSPRIAPSVADSPFLVAPTRPDLALEVRWSEEDLRPKGELIFESGGPWKLHREPDRLVFSVCSSLLGSEPYKTARVTPDFRSGEVLLRRNAFPDDSVVDPLQFPLNELLVIHLLGTGLGAVVHACGLVNETRGGILFCGQSGDGKTTTARLWDGILGTRILSDDRIILRKTDGRFWMHGTPWHGEAMYAENEKAPLAAVFILGRGETNTAVPLPAEDAIALLLARSFVPFHSAAAIEFTMRFFEDLAASVPVFRLAFRPDASAVEYVRRIVR